MIVDEPLLSGNSWKQFNEWASEQMKKNLVHFFIWTSNWHKTTEVKYKKKKS